MAIRCKYFKRREDNTDRFYCTSPCCNDKDLRDGRYPLGTTITNYCFNGGTATITRGGFFRKKEVRKERCPYYETYY